MLTQYRAKELLYYNPATGIFKWRHTVGCTKAYSIAGTLAGGYIRIQIDNELIYAHRIAFLFVTGRFPENQVDHINGIKSDNTWINLREVTNDENHKNLPLYNNNKSGFTGVRWDRANSKWHSRIQVNKKSIHLGFFTKLQDAITARQDANVKYGFHRNHGRKA